MLSVNSVSVDVTDDAGPLYVRDVEFTALVLARSPTANGLVSASRRTLDAQGQLGTAPTVLSRK